LATTRAPRLGIDQRHLADHVTRLCDLDRFPAHLDFQLAVEHDVHQIADGSFLENRLARLEFLRCLRTLEKAADVQAPLPVIDRTGGV